MRLICAVLLLACGLAAADRKITWDPDKSELSWVSTADSKTKYTINLRTRLMAANGKDAKRFSESEQFYVLQFLMALESYTMQSEDWYPDPQRWQEQHEQKQLPKREADRAAR